MLKIISDSAWSGDLWNEDNPRVALIKVASNGLSGLDKQKFVKRACASSDELLAKLASIKVNPGEELAHEIALGATEFYGPNRNGDGFRKEACRKYHNTFVKHGHCYRDHQNTDPKKSYGVVKASAYNEGMGRVELIVAYNGDERAAKANGGLVADKEMEKLASGKDIPLSMACLSNPYYPVLVKDRGYIGISRIETGMLVMTRDGTYHKVIAINRRKFTGTLYEFRWEGCTIPLEVTSDHLLLLQTNDGDWKWVAAENITTGMFLKHYSTYSNHSADGFFDNPCRITKIRTREVTDIQTYNIEVDGEPSYIAGGIVSHNCSVPFDVCSYCGNKAETQDNYCRGTHEGGHCKAGGLKHNMGQLVSVDGELHHLHADNTKPDFFDISHVFVPADRIAYSSGRLTKSASARQLSGAELARQACLTAPDYIQGAMNSNALYFLKEAVSNFHNAKLWQKRASFLGVMNSKELKDTHIPRRYKFAEVQRALLDAGVCLNPTQYVQLVSGLPYKQAAFVGEIIAPLSNDFLEKDAEYVPEIPQGSPRELRNWVYAQHLPSVFPDRFMKQAALASLEEAPPFSLSVQDVYDLQNDPQINALAKQYGLYKAAFVAGLPTNLQQTAAELIVGRDYLSF